MFLPLLNNRIELQFVEEQCKPEFKANPDGTFLLIVWKGHTAKDLCKIILEIIFFSSREYAVKANYSIFTILVEELSSFLERTVTCEVLVSALLDKEKFEEIMNKGCKEILK